MAGNDGTDMGDAQVGGGPCAVAKSGTRKSEEVRK